MDQVRARFRRLEYEYSLHAVDRSIEKHLTRREAEEAVAGGAIIEEHPTDKYGPSCLIFGMTATDRPLRIQYAHPHTGRVQIITLYEPHPDEWIDFKIRRTR